MQKNYFILAVSDAEHYSGCKIPAIEVAKDRLDQKRWPIYANTRNRKIINEGDLCLIYVGGEKEMSGNFYGEFTIEKIESGRRITLVDKEDILTDTPDRVIQIKDLLIYKEPMRAKTTLKKMSFFPENESRWGVVLMGGCRKLSEPDYKIYSSSLMLVK